MGKKTQKIKPKPKKNPTTLRTFGPAFLPERSVGDLSAKPLSLVEPSFAPEMKTVSGS